MTRAVGALAALLATWLICALASAAPPELRLSASTTTVEVGSTVDVTLQVMSTEGAPTQATLSPTPGFSIASSRASPSQQVTIINGVRADRRGMTATWTLRADRIGTFTVGPATVDIGAVHHRGPGVKLTVVAAGTRPQAQPPPSSLFGGPLDPLGFFDQGPAMPEPAMPQVPLDPKLALDRPREAIAFLHAVVDKPSVVVGEQIMLTIYLYIDVNVREPEFGDAHEASTDDFLRKSLMKDETTSEDAGFGAAGGRVYAVKVLRRMALFPLKSGALAIGPMRLAVLPRGGPRESERLSVRVSEPPIAGRPAGYEAGTVGSFLLTADVAPRTTPKGGAVAVTVSLSGSGNLPTELPLPLQAGVQWLQPDVHEKLGPMPGSLFGGARTFSYVVQLDREGDIDLGELALPYFNPATRKFAVTRAALGVIRVTKSTAEAPSVEVARLPELPPTRKTLGATRTPTARISDRRWGWSLLYGPPATFVLAAIGAAAARRSRTRAAERRNSPASALKQRERLLDAALKGDDGGAVDAASVRLIEAAAIASLGANLRASTGAALVRELTEAGAPEPVASEVRELLAACEAARFAPDGNSTSQARERAASARKLAQQLAGLKR